MLYIIWLSISLVLATWLNYLEWHNSNQSGYKLGVSLSIMLFSLVATFDGVLAPYFSWVNNTLPNPHSGIHGLIVMISVAISCLIWIFTPVLCLFGYEEWRLYRKEKSLLDD